MNGNFKVYSLSALFNKQQPKEELFDVDCPISSACVVGSAKGLVCLFNQRETCILNPTFRKSKKLYVMWGSSLAAKCGFGYDESHDDYKAQFISCCRNSSHHVVNIYSLRSDSWTTVHEHFQGIFLINCLGKYVNGKLYWASSTGISTYIVSKIISFDLADETWGSVALPFVDKTSLISNRESWE
ncbi:hypothetical protein CQW23_25683 [Capsicum baccatum]|uniref:F-box associated beta-propeller type 1 domain-containing protein n=1 Tax=Capsicum baccatum TaxID=33114 RepID=A0A2G2VLP2_CAPBA|nr:hypothetical protein CQW23_25683 [Capsicum baccatum]